MNKTVFISSTYEDLKEYRRAIWDLLEKFNVNVRGMEQFGARKEAPLTTCLAEVEQSDVYLGVIAFRLGSIDSQTIYLVDEQNALFAVRYIDQDEKKKNLKLSRGYYVRGTLRSHLRPLRT